MKYKSVILYKTQSVAEGVEREYLFESESDVEALIKITSLVKTSNDFNQINGYHSGYLMETLVNKDSGRVVYDFKEFKASFKKF